MEVQHARRTHPGFGLHHHCCNLWWKREAGRTTAVNHFRFIAGNNQAAEKARSVLRSRRTCLVLAPKATDADAVLEISVDTQTQGGMIGGFGGRTWIASGTLTLRSGELIWSRSVRFSDAPLISGGKTSGGSLVHELANDSGCKKRSK